MWRRIFHGSALALSLLLLAGVLGMIFAPGITVASVLSVTGRVRNCDWEAASQAVPVANRRGKVQDRLAADSRLVKKEDGLELWHTEAGQWWIPAGSAEVLFLELAEQLTGIYEHPRAGVRKGDVVVDCGSNIGMTLRRWLDAGAAKVVAIEPAPVNLECIRRNLRREIAEGKVIVEAAGVWNEESEMDLLIDEENVAAHSFLRRLQGGSQSVRVPLTTIDRLVKKHGLERVDLIKMDIEGAERNALEGARATMAEWKPRLALCVYHLPDDPQQMAARVYAARKDYRQECGPCQVGSTLIVPHVHFYF